jgi:hypothetical protein
MVAAAAVQLTVGGSVQLWGWDVCRVAGVAVAELLS